MTKEDFYKHLDILQNIINRMAANSTSSKNYCVSLLVGLLALNQLKVGQSLIIISLLPVVLFCFLDSYYLFLERHFKKQYKIAVEKWQDDNLMLVDLFAIETSEKGSAVLVGVFKAMKSFSIWPFYLSLLAVVIVFWYVKSTPVVAG